MAGGDGVLRVAGQETGAGDPAGGGAIRGEIQGVVPVGEGDDEDRRREEGADQQEGEGCNA